MAGKSSRGNFFEDFSLGQDIAHATPRTVTSGDVALYTALTGSRFALQSSDAFARALGYSVAPVDDLIVFHIVFGKTVPDVSLNAIANLGYANCRFLAPVFPGDTLSASSRVVGMRENSNRRSGIVYVQTVGANQHGAAVLEYMRWVMVRKREETSPAPPSSVPPTDARVDPATLGTAAVPVFDPTAYDTTLAGTPYRWADYEAGERIDHADGMTIEDAEHQIATRLWQNTARVHFNQHAAGEDGRRLIYGGHIISLARALSFNGLGNAFHIAAINGGRHVAPSYAGDTIYAWSEVLEKAEIAGRKDVGALRLRSVAVKNRLPGDFPLMADENTYEDGVVLDLDYWVLLPR
jgi:2-methylfumaryl-CoA hydratase